MEKKRILIVSRAFYPENSPRSFRATELAKEFAKQGHDVTVLINQRDYNYEEYLKKHPLKIQSFGNLRFKTLTKSKIKFIGDWKRKFGRLLFMLFDYPNIEIMWRLKKTLKNYKNYDLLITIAVPHSIHWGTAWAVEDIRQITKTWVADCGDPYMGNTLESFPIPFYFGYLEKFAFRKADYITIPIETARNSYYPEFHRKIKVIPQGFNFDEVQFPENHINENKNIKFAYAGGLAQAGVRSPIKLIDYLLQLDQEFEFHIYSNSNTEFLIPYIKNSKGKIILHNPLPREQLLPILNRMDFLINFDNGTYSCLPSKLIDYALTGRPILNINPLNPDHKIIDEFLSGNYQNAFVIDDINQYNIKSVADKFLELAK